MSSNRKKAKPLSEHIEKLAREKITKDGKKVTRAEALAQEFWKLALGYEEELPNGKIKKHGPNRQAMELILERMEGRVPTTTDKDKKKKATVADRVGEQSRRRLNALAKNEC